MEEQATRWAPRVLLVDDDAETVALLKAVLEEEGIQVVGEAGSGTDALEMARAALPDVVLMDLRMPGMDGFRCTNLLKQEHPWMQVVFLTFYDELLPEQDPQQAGAFAYLIKGCSPKLMRDVIAQASRHAWEERAGRHGAPA